MRRLGVPFAVVSLHLVACSGDQPGSPDLPFDATSDIEGSFEEVRGGARPIQPLEVRFHGVMGFSIRHGDDLLLTAPLLSNPSLTDVLFRTVKPIPTRIDQFLPERWVVGAKAILVGHAHYDHLLDVPYVYNKTDHATIYGSVSMKHILAGVDPNRQQRCAGTTPAPELEVPEDRVVALNDPENDRVDHRLCATQKTCTGAQEGAGAWIPVPGSNIRIRALCSSHPPQFFWFHFGAGCVTQDMCALPEKAADWLEGATLAYLIDFLDPLTGATAFRVYFQDAPTDAPVGHVSPDLLEEKRIDLALLCTGTYDQVDDHPATIIRALTPRYVIAGHWEDFFRPQSVPVVPLPFFQLRPFVVGLDDALRGGREEPALVDGLRQDARFWVPEPGTEFRFGRAD